MKKIVQNINYRSQHHGANLTEEQILSVSFKEYLFSLDDHHFQSKLLFLSHKIIYGIEICDSFVDKWKNKIDLRYSHGVANVSAANNSNGKAAYPDNDEIAYKRESLTNKIQQVNSGNGFQDLPV